jgi:steroid delta-isomerase-like uncharacterized protein
MSNKSIALKYFETASKDPDAALTLFASKAEFLFPMGAIPMLEGVRAYLRGYQKSFPDSGFDITRVVEQGDEVAVEGFWFGTHTGPMQTPDGKTILATNRKVRAPFATFLTIRDGKITSHRGYWDMAGFMMQLGIAK